MAEEIIDITDEEDGQPELYSRRDILAPAIQHVIAALGGLEDTPTGPVYVLGDECYGCLKDLKRFWRKDDTDDERTVARIFYESAVLSRDLIPIILETSGKGDVENRCAIAAVDLMTGMTWPIDVAAELRELDEMDGESENVDYTTLISAQLNYKRAIVADRDILSAIFDLVVPCMAKERWNRTERDKQIVTLILYLLRNLAFIRDLPLNPNLSADQAELSSLQSRYIGILHDTLVLDFLLTFASNAIDDPLANAQNTLVLEIFYLLFRSIPPASILPSLPSSNGRPPATSNALRSALENEFKSSRLQKRHLTSRHSRFGTTIQVSSSRTGQSLILHRGAAVIQGKGTGDVLDRGKKKLAKRSKMRDELTGGAASAGGGIAGSGGETRLSYESRENLGNVAKVFIESCFNPFLSSLIKDIRAERSKVTEKDNLRLLFVTKFFMQFYLAMRERDIAANADKPKATDEANGEATESKSDEEKMSLNYSLVLEVVQRGWVGWILRRMREAMEMKPKQWTEIQAGLGCLTQLLLLVDAMSTSTDEELQDAAGTLQYQIYYNGEALERMLECMKSYKDQSFGYLEENIHLAHVLLKLLERWGNKNGGLYIRKTKKKKGTSRSTGVPEEEGVVDDASDEEMRVADEILQEMTLEKFEHKFANEEVTVTLMAYLSKFQEFDSPEKMKWLVTLIHRQAVRAKAEGLYFKVSTLAQFQTVLSVQKMLPKDQPYKDLVRLLNYLLRQFFKAVETDPLVIADALFPKNRGLWKQFSSWEPPEKGKKGKGGVEDSDDEQQEGRFPPDIRVKRGHSWSEQLGIAIACLCEKEERHFVEWTKELLRLIIDIKQLTINEVDKAQEVERDSDEEEEDVKKPTSDNPSMAALAKLEDFMIPYTEDGRAEAATKNPHLKLLWNLIGFEIVDKAATEFEWYCPAAKLPVDLQRSLNLINNFLLDPLDLGGKKALQMISKPGKRKTQTTTKSKRRGPTEQAFLDDGLLDDDEDEGAARERRKKGEERESKRKKERQEAKSAQFIEDSDAELGDDDEFFKRELALREKSNNAAAAGIATQGAGTKPKKRKVEEDEEDRVRKRRKSEAKKKAKVSSSEEESSEEVDIRKPSQRSHMDGTPALSDEEPLFLPNRGSTAGSPPPPSSRAPSSKFDSDDEELISRPRFANGKRISTASSALDFDDEEEEDLPPSTQGAKAGRQTKRLVISDEEEE